MSRIHVAFRKQRSDGDSIVYGVESSDFEGTPLIGEIRIDTDTRQYEFVPLGPLAGKAVIPPYVFDLPESEWDAVIARNYPNAKYGGWTSRIAQMVSRLQEREEFPDESFGVT
jgi:hypothetical protein